LVKISNLILNYLKSKDENYQKNEDNTRVQLYNTNGEKLESLPNNQFSNTEKLASLNSTTREKVSGQLESQINEKSPSLNESKAQQQMTYADEKKPPKINRNSKFRYSNYMIDTKSNAASFKSSSNPLQANNHSSSSTNLSFLNSSIRNSIVSNCIMKFESQLSNSVHGNESLEISSNSDYETTNNLESSLNNNPSISIKKVKIISFYLKMLELNVYHLILFLSRSK